jgi:N-methylhydantoinase B/oxoprolinase/acetone carboxylase alpha subunit
LRPADDAFRLDAPGGGYGDPLLRDPERVLADVRDGAVTVEAAQRDYGVVVAKGAGSWAIDAQATRALRARIKQAVGAGRLRRKP